MARKKRKIRKRVHVDISSDGEDAGESSKVTSTDVITKKVTSVALNKQEEQFKSLILKRIIKENHNSVIKRIAFNRVDKNSQNLLASISDRQVNIYDCQHCGNHLDICLHYSLPSSEKSNYSACCWLQYPRGYEIIDSTLHFTTETYPTSVSNSSEDIFLAVGGGQLIQIISISNVKVIQQIHIKLDESIKDLSQVNTQSLDYYQSKEIFDYSSNLLLSISNNGNIRIWDWPRATCILCVPPSLYIPSSLSTFSKIDKINNNFVIGTTRGELLYSTILITPNLKSNEDADPFSVSLETLSILPKAHSSPIDCIKFISANKLVSKSTDGKIVFWRRGNTKTNIQNNDPVISIEENNNIQNDEIKIEEKESEEIKDVKEGNDDTNIQSSKNVEENVQSENDDIEIENSLDDQSSSPSSEDRWKQVISFKSLKIKRAVNYQHYTRFDLTSDGKYLCVGDEKGALFIYSLYDGRLIESLSHRQAKTAVNGCLFSHDDKSICSVGGPHLLRWEVPPVEKPENANSP